jgi:aryl-alcohol dehydrogenase-like predicted oxidoreductase
MIPSIELAPGYSISRLIKGGWHLAGGHGAIDAATACRDMAEFVDAGVTAFDCADIYTGVEELIGRFRREYPAQARRVRVHTKFVPDLDLLATVDRAYVESIIDRSLARLGVPCLDLVQFHWWDYGVPRYVEIALELDRLRRAGKIERIGVTNFGTAQLREILDAGVPVLAHQLQYSLLDDRPAHDMSGLCAARAVGTAGQPIAHQVPADHRRIRRLAAVPGVAVGPARRGGSPRQRHRHGSHARDARHEGGGGGDRGCDQHGPPAGTCRNRRFDAR